MISFQRSEYKPSFSLHHLHWPTRSTKTESKHLNQSQLSGTSAQKWHRTATWRPECSPNTNTHRNQNNTSVETWLIKISAEEASNWGEQRKGALGKRQLQAGEEISKAQQTQGDVFAQLTETLLLLGPPGCHPLDPASEGRQNDTPWNSSVLLGKLILKLPQLKWNLTGRDDGYNMKWFRVHFWAPYDWIYACVSFEGF